MLAQCKEAKGEEDRVENLNQECYRYCGRYFRALFGMQFRPAALLTLISLMTSLTYSAPRHLSP